MKISIIGASSFIGGYIFSSLQEIYPNSNIVGTYFQHKTNNTSFQLNIQDHQDLKNFILNFLPDTIFWIAGNKDLKITEMSLQSSREINTYPIQTLIGIIKTINNYNPKIIFFSTDYVFSGNRGFYTQDDIPSPTTNYGVSNYEAEQELIAQYNNYLIFRTSAVMGRGGTFFEFLIHSLYKQDALELFDNILFSPTPIHALMESIPLLIEYPTPAILHLSVDMAMSRFQFGTKIQEAINQLMDKKSTTKIIPSKAQGYFLPNLSLRCSEVFLEKVAKYQGDFTLWLK